MPRSAEQRERDGQNEGMKTAAVWSMIDDERASLADQLGSVPDEQWDTPSLCSELSVREVLAHLTVSGALSGPRWFAGVVRARFDFDKQVDQRLREQLGSSSAETLERFRRTIGSRVSPPLPKLALLGEVVVHGQDIRRPVGLRHDHSMEVLDAVANYYAGSDMVVLARSRVRGFRLEANDGRFATGEGPLVRGSTLALIMAMTGRREFHAELSGPGLALFTAQV